ncbi:DNA-binding transcriptional MerR regulator [Nocardiopsis mwathae]|uniref:DNA-binding transcriptional MerR regulator n=1 Tax=Nocardiopsis mwathae TaxID=1472723 RepID=A0A7W9YMW0_9ACTN|nr:MerR family transcriptional regulator [Nocardiopsis mwathae]MBB6174026.1 DNA-binding transcriptional MerR regulator [Nocardiopsis mwathae]
MTRENFGTQRLAIGQVARLAGVSTRTIRHYHQVGLLPEAERDSGGRRVYRLPDIARLLWIRKLAELGLTLPEIGDAIAGAHEQEEILGELERTLSRQEEKIRAQREAVRRLREAGSSPGLIGASASEEVRALLAEVGGVRISGEGLELALLLEKVVGADKAALDAVTQSLVQNDERLATWGDRLVRLYDDLADAEPDDPRVEEYAREQAAYCNAVKEAELARGIDIDALLEKLPSESADDEIDEETFGLHMEALMSGHRPSPAQRKAMGRFFDLVDPQ